MEAEKVVPVSNTLASQPAVLKAEIVVRDKDGNVKYAGPIILIPQVAA